jgi:hypothetical protein
MGDKLYPKLGGSIMKRDLREKARFMRQQGLSINHITKVLGVAKSSVSVWVRDIPLTEEQTAKLEHNRRQYAERNFGANTNRDRSRKLRITYQEAGRTKARENRPLHLTGCMLYWAEGAKTKNGIYFVNSDPNMVKLFIRFLRDEFNVENSEVAVRIHCHTTDTEEIGRIEDYWLKLLMLPHSCLRKTYIKQGSDTRHNVLRNGVCDIRVHRTELVQHIYGAIQEYGGFVNPEWLF